VHHPAALSAARLKSAARKEHEETIMKWESNFVGYPISGGYPISVWQKQAATPTTKGVPVGHTNSVRRRPNIIRLSDNVMLAHYQRDRR
jgi:hypothetical protein